MVRTALPLHAHPAMSLLRADPLGLPMLRLAPAAPAPTPRAWHPTATPAAVGPCGPCKPVPRRSRTWSWPGALGRPRPRTKALTLPARREAEQEGEAPGCPAKDLLHCFDVHTAVHAPRKHRGSGHLTLSGSSITSMQCSTVPHVDPREGRQQRCCRLVMRPPGKVPGVTVALHLEGMVGGGNGTCSRRERC